MNQTSNLARWDLGVLHSCIFKFGKPLFTKRSKLQCQRNSGWHQKPRNKHSHLYDMTWLKMCRGRWSSLKEWHARLSQSLESWQDLMAQKTQANSKEAALQTAADSSKSEQPWLLQRDGCCSWSGALTHNHIGTGVWSTQGRWTQKCLTLNDKPSRETWACTNKI